MFGPDGFGRIMGPDGEITGLGGAKIAIIARWTITRSGVYPDGRPKLRFRAWFSWQQPMLMKMCQNGTIKGRVRVFINSPSKGKEQIDIVEWDQWKVNEDGMLELENISAFDTAPIRL